MLSSPSYFLPKIEDSHSLSFALGLIDSSSSFSIALTSLLFRSLKLDAVRQTQEGPCVISDVYSQLAMLMLPV